MFVSREFVDDLKTQRDKAIIDALVAKAEANVLKTSHKVLETNLDHLRLRVNQLEKERAQLTHAILGVKMSVPEFEAVSPVEQAGAFSEMPSFEDVGDESANILGIRHDGEGNIVYGKPILEAE